MSWRDRDYAREEEYRGGGGFGVRARGMSMTMWLIVINLAITVLDTILGGSTRGSVLAPGYYGEFNIEKAVHGLQLWRWFTYQFVHAGFMHLIFNMIGLYFFGPMMERWWGSRRFLAFYLLCGVSGAFLFTALAYIPGVLAVSNASYLVGASGSVFGILIGCAVLFPHQRVMLLIPPIPMSMRTLALVILGIAGLGLIAGSMNAAGDAAHLGGAALGFFLVKNPRLLGFADGLGGMWTNWQVQQKRRSAQRSRESEIAEQRDVDAVLDKVRREGLQSLTAREKRILQRATDRQQGG